MDAVSERGAAIVRAAVLACAAACICLAGGGCVTEKMVDLGASTPSVQVKPQGVYFDGRPSTPAEVVEMLDRAGVARSSVVHIMLDGEVRDMREARRLMFALAEAGYTRPVLVTKRHAEAAKVDRSATAPAAGPAPSGRRRSVRYKRASE